MDRKVSMSSSFLTPVSRTTVTADVCRKLVGHLMRGHWVAGEKIPPERILSQKLGVGRASLREALKALEIMGMIETRLGEGTFVCGRSEFFARPLLWAITGSNISDARELVEARKLIEVELAGLAAERATADDLTKIGETLDVMEASLGDPGRFLEADVQFHLAIAEAGHNTILLNSILLIRNLMRQWVSTALTSDGVAAEAVEQHKRIFLAIAKRRSEQARRCMDIHLETMAKHLSLPKPQTADSHGSALAATEPG
jgi:GntR family transcriptional repressor for pyruvate dehydrogenase complex